MKVGYNAGSSQASVKGESRTTRTDTSPLDTTFFRRTTFETDHSLDGNSGGYSHWLSVNQIRRMQRMRRQAVLEAMNSGELPFEQRGRIRYARLSDVLLWEERRLAGVTTPSKRRIHPCLEDLID